MDIDELLKEKHSLETQIGELLSQFSHKTGIANLTLQCEPVLTPEVNALSSRYVVVGWNVNIKIEL